MEGEKKKRKYIISGFIAVAMSILVVCLLILYSKTEKVEVEFSENATWFEYDSNNLLGIKATVYDGCEITYIFDAEKCPFDKKDVKWAFEHEKIWGCRANGMTTFKDPVDCHFVEKDGDAYLIIKYDDVYSPEKLDGFCLVTKEDNSYRWGYTRSTTNIEVIIITEKYKAGENGYSFNTKLGNKYYQIWNLDDSGVWGDVRVRSYHWDDMPLE